MHDIRTDPRFKIRPSNAALRHKSKALLALRTALAMSGNIVTDPMLLAVLYMGMFERLHGMLGSEFQIHTKTLKHLLKLRGGLENVEERIRTVLSNYDFFTSVAIGNKVLDTTAVRRIPLPTSSAMSLRLKPLIQLLPENFQILHKRDQISASTLEILIRINKEYLRRHGIDINATAGPHMAMFESSRPRYATWFEACPSMQLPNVDGQIAFEKLLCLGLLLFACYYFSPTREGSITMAGSRAELTRTLLRGVKYYDPDQNDCLAWVWAVTISAHLSATGSIADSVVLVADFFDQFPELANMDRAADLFCRYFYEEDLIVALSLM